MVSVKALTAIGTDEGVDAVEFGVSAVVSGNGESFATLVTSAADSQGVQERGLWRSTGEKVESFSGSRGVDAGRLETGG